MKHVSDTSFECIDEGDINRLIVCVDDTDDLTKTTSTGKIADLISEAAVALGGVMQLNITRHQLLIRDDVPYTSHNSSMAFAVYLRTNLIEEFRQNAISIILDNMADTSDPGLCIVNVPKVIGRHSQDEQYLNLLIEYGHRAKVDYCSKQSAYDLANSIPWVILSEHGGTGQGVVGALAGCGLRLSENDGRFRGKWNLSNLSQNTNPTVASLTAELQNKLNGEVAFVDVEGNHIDLQIPCHLASQVKPVFLNNAFTIVCEVKEGCAYPLDKEAMGDKSKECSGWSYVCDSFVWDNDFGECIDGKASCKNCLHRRWTADGFSCLKNLHPDKRV